ncbi:MAG: hypothetical protein WAO50_11500 [Candidatus Nanopelagicales bacterium]
MSAIQAVGLFVGLPLVIGVIAYALVYAPSWIRSEAGDEGDDASPLLLVSARPLPDPSRLPGDIASPQAPNGGGVSAGW